MKSITYPSITALGLCLLMTGIAFAQEDISVETAAQSAVQTDTASVETSAEAEAEVETEVETSPARAREAAQARRAEAASQREDAQATRSENRANIRAELDERARERITNLAANVSNRMDAAAARMQNIIDRLESRIDKLAASGLDTAEASAALASAQTSIDAAVGELASIDVTVASTISAESPRAAWAETKATYTAIRSQLRTAHNEMKASVQALRDAAQVPATLEGSAAAESSSQVSTDEDSSAITSETSAAAE